MRVTKSSTDPTAMMKRHSILADRKFTLPSFEQPDPNQFIDLFSTGLAAYLREFFKDNRFLDNQGLMLDDNENNRQGKLVDLDSLFVFPAASQQHITPEVFNTFKQQDLDERTLSLAQLMHTEPRLILLGDPGSGKTTFIQWLSSSLAYDSENAARRYLGNLLPLVLTARRLANTQEIPNSDSNAKSTGDSQLLLSALIASMNPNISQPLQHNLSLVKTLLKQGQVILMVDGIDEISKQQSDWLARCLRDFLAAYPNTRLILTARVVGFTHSEFWFPELAEATSTDDAETKRDNRDPHQPELDAQQLYPLYYLAPFDDARRTHFAQNWAKQYHPKKGEIPNFIQLLKNACSATNYLNALSRNPVLLTMICFIQWRRGQLPHGRAELYRRIVSTYLVQLDQARRKDAGYSHQDLPFDYEDMEFWIAKLAWLMQCGDLTPQSLSQTETERPFEALRQRQTSITASALQAFFAAHIASVTGNPQAAPKEARQLIEFIKKRTGFLIPKGMEDQEEIFSFSHLSFQEYFAGYFIAQYWQEWSAKEKELHTLKQTLRRNTWQEVWQLAFEETKRRQQSAMLRTLFNDETFVYLPESDFNLLLTKILSNTTLRFEPTLKQQQLVKCWNSANKNYFNRTLTLFWSNNSLLNRVLQPQQCTELSLNHATPSQLQALLPKLSEFRQLTELSIGEQSFSDVAVLAELTNLIRLYLGHTQVSDISALAKLPNLTNLYLAHTKITDIADLAKLTHLEELSLSHTQIRSISDLVQLTHLVWLDLGHTQITDISALAKLINLNWLDLSHTPIRDLSVLLQLPSLRILRLDSASADKHSNVIQRLKEKKVIIDPF